MKPTLITSFTTWKAHQKSNASDDLLAKLLAGSLLPPNIHLLRQIPVDFELAPARVIAKIGELKPDLAICCGMAEKRQILTVESTATHGDRALKTSVDLENLVARLSGTEISHDAGEFVCNGLYFSVLSHLNARAPHMQCIFVHVPVLTATNWDAIAADFLAIVSILRQPTAIQAPATRVAPRIVSSTPTRIDRLKIFPHSTD